MTESNCQLCNSGVVQGEFQVPESMFKTGWEYTYLCCANCGSLRRRDFVSQDDLYPTDYYSMAHDPRNEIGSGMRRLVGIWLAKSTFSYFAIFVRVIKIFSPIKQLRTLSRMLLSVNAARRLGSVEKILDVGTGSGYLPYLLSLSKRKTLGIDPYTNIEWIDGSCEVRHATLSDIEENFDLIMFHHSLEHMAEPEIYLKSAIRLLNRNGIVIIRVPKKDSSAWKQFETNWFQLDAPRHEFIPTTDGMKILLDRCGLKIINQYDDSSSVQIWLSDYVQRGMSQMDEATNFSTFRSDDSSFVAKVRNLTAACFRNTRNTGDQTVIIATLA
jgi:SAM-dependent methyltransferase